MRIPVKASRVFLFTAIIFVACNQAEQDRRIIHSPAPAPMGSQEITGLRSIDKSPMDMSYYPVDYPVLKMSGKTDQLPVARVIYSRPSRDGRTIFGNLIEYGSPWRLGANEATEIEFFRDVVISGDSVKKGRYVIYCIPYQDKWTIILNEDLFTWGLKINRAKDLFSFDIPVTPGDQRYEAFTMEFERAPNGFILAIAWDNIRGELPIQL